MHSQCIKLHPTYGRNIWFDYQLMLVRILLRTWCPRVLSGAMPYGRHRSSPWNPTSTSPQSTSCHVFRRSLSVGNSTWRAVALCGLLRSAHSSRTSSSERTAQSTRGRPRGHLNGRGSSLPSADAQSRSGTLQARGRGQSMGRHRKFESELASSPFSPAYAIRDTTESAKKSASRRRCTGVGIHAFAAPPCLQIRCQMPNLGTTRLSLSPSSKRRTAPMPDNADGVKQTIL